MGSTHSSQQDQKITVENQVGDGPSKPEDNGWDMISGITYTTSVENLVSILRSRKLMTKQELHRTKTKYVRGDEDTIVSNTVTRDEFPAVYFGLLRKSDIGASWPPRYVGNFEFSSEKHITLVFTTALLRKKNWHLNFRDNMGYITKDTYTFRTLDSFYKRLTDADDAELMIHDSVSLVGLEEIWTASERLYSKVVDMVPEDLKSKVRLRSEIPDQIYESFTDLTSKQLTRIGIDTDIEPNFCYWIGGRYPVDTQRRDSMHNMDKLLANCQAKLSYRDDPKSSFLGETSWFSAAISRHITTTSSDVQSGKL